MPSKFLRFFAGAALDVFSAGSLYFFVFTFPPQVFSLILLCHIQAGQTCDAQLLQHNDYPTEKRAPSPSLLTIGLPSYARAKNKTFSLTTPTAAAEERGAARRLHTFARPPPR